MGRRIKWYVTSAFFLITLSAVSMDCDAYFGKNKDYIFTEELSEDRGETHYLEFVSKETYTVEPGDTLWDIAEDYWGKGIYYQRLLTDNEDVVDIPEHLMPGTELGLGKTLYLNVGIADYINEDQFGFDLLVEEDAFEIDDSLGLKNYSLPYCIYASVPYVNDLKEADPYVHWEDFQEEVSRCSREICGDLVSDLSFERYQVTGLGNLCGYRFTFDAGDTEYVIMAYFCYNKTTKSEAFALCEKKRCTETVLDMVRGKTCYAAVRFLDPNTYREKLQDYRGAETWNYPQLRNPFATAMWQLYSGPLKQVEDYPEDYAILWEEPEFEKAVREELSRLWQLTEEEKQAFAERDVTAGDLALIEEMVIDYYSIKYDEKEYLRVQLNDSEDYGTSITYDSQAEEQLMETLEDLRHFHGLKRLKIRFYAPDIPDLSCLENLTGLKELDMNLYSADTQAENLDFLGKLTALRKLRIDGKYGEWKYGFDYGHNQYFEGISDLSVLRNCPHLAYLTLTAGRLESYDFLENLPNLYQISMSGANIGENIESLLPNACFIEINGKSVRFETGEGYEQY